jgi:GTPase SAR1 family protein
LGAAMAEPMEEDDSDGAELPSRESMESKPSVVLFIGMAGSGKTTLMHRAVTHLAERKKRVYTINLDPAVRTVPYPIHVDIRDTVQYANVMKHFKLGPNGAIMTSLNLFATKFDQVLNLLTKRESELDYILIDTPGQIEVFNWSASGTLICDMLALSYPTSALYIVDTPRCEAPVTFMANMLYACSILYKTKLPFVVAFNKCDVTSAAEAIAWMKDFTKLHEALQQESSYAASLAKSMSLAMQEFYEGLRTLGLSAFSDDGMDGFEEALAACREEFFETYLPYLDAKATEVKKRRNREMQEKLEAATEGFPEQQVDDLSDDDENGEDQTELQQLRDMLAP